MAGTWVAASSVKWPGMERWMQKIGNSSDTGRRLFFHTTSLADTLGTLPRSDLLLLRARTWLLYLIAQHGTEFELQCARV
jgi:hypothetical protein